MKILIASDGSATAAQAVRSLIAHVRWFREQPEMHLLFVHPPVPIGLAVKHVPREVLDRYYREEGEAGLKEAADLLSAASLPHTSHIHVGAPAETIIKLAHELGCELICLGTHGRGAMTNAIVGSVVEKVLHLTDIPVLVAR